MPKVFLDTNFLIDLFRFKLLDQFFRLEVEYGKFQLFTFKNVLNELKTLKKEKFARIALEWVQSNAKIIEKVGKTDKLFLSLPLDKNIIIATNDKYLRKKLKEKGFKVMYVRSLKRIEVD